MNKLDRLIDSLAADAAPVRPRSSWLGWGAFAAMAASTLGLSYLALGFRADVLRLAPAPEVAIAAGLMILVAIASGATAIRVARPQVGAPASGAPWALAALLVLPAVVLAGLAAAPAGIPATFIDDGLRCLAVGLGACILTIAVLALWQGGGAPVRPEHAAWMAGLAGGSVGALAVTLECPVEGLAHLGIWHVAIVPLAGLAARLVLPRFLRW